MRTFAHVFVVLLFFLAVSVSGYEVVMKSGTSLKGTKVSEDAERIVLKDPSGIEITIKKANIDLKKTEEANKPAAASADKAPDVKKKGRVYTQEDLERLREKYDLGEKSFGGEFSKVTFANKPSKAPARQSNFRADVLLSGVPVLVDFWAPWCGPCRQVSPRVEAVGAQFADRAKIYKVNIDDFPDLAAEYEISAIPTLMFFKDGKPVSAIVGAAKQEVIASKLESILE